jgi:hypothetical protein
VFPISGSCIQLQVLNRHTAKPPVVFFYKYMGGWSRVKPQMSFAAWANGKVIWRTPQLDEPVQGEPGDLKFHYYSGKVSPVLISKTLSHLSSKAENAREWSYIFPDAQTYHRIVRVNGHTIDLGCSAVPPLLAPHGQQTKEWKQGRETWFAIGKAKDKLIPKVKKEIPPPSDVDIASWFAA